MEYEDINKLKEKYFVRRVESYLDMKIHLESIQFDGEEQEPSGYGMFETMRKLEQS